MRTRVTEMFGISYPIVQGGLAYLADANLCAAVSNAGGLGQITALTYPTPERFAEEIVACRRKTTRPFGVNIVLSERRVNWREYVDVAIQYGVEIFSVTGGNPQQFFDYIPKNKDFKTLVLVSEVRQAKKAEQLGAAAIICVGQEGGGHLGRSDVGSLVLVPLVVDSVSVPVIASGGIGCGKGMAAALALGADGIEMGTRFVATKECVAASARYHEALLDSSENDTLVIKRSLGTPARTLKNEWTSEILKIEQENVDFETLFPYINGERNQKFALHGQSDGFGWAGQIVGTINDIPAVHQLIDRIVLECKERSEELRRIF
ncbi:MAG: NAD(P)H-dependent flavin oxidoreductase [Bacilli bacterium]